VRPSVPARLTGQAQDQGKPTTRSRCPAREKAVSSDRAAAVRGRCRPPGCDRSPPRRVGAGQLLDDFRDTGRRQSVTEACLGRRPRRATADRTGLFHRVGLSALGGATILAENVDLTRFASARAVVKHSGLAPREKTSGTYTGRTRLTFVAWLLPRPEAEARISTNGRRRPLVGNMWVAMLWSRVRVLRCRPGRGDRDGYFARL
jgi:hypothetical protein